MPKSRNVQRLGRLFWIVLCLIIVLSMAFPAYATDTEINSTSQKTVRIGYYEDNNGFQMGFSDGERKSGYAYEYYQEIAKYAGWKYEYIYGPWGDLYDKLLDGEIDIMAGVSKTQARMELMLFPDNNMGTESYYIFVPTNYNDIISTNPASLNGKNIGVNDKSLMLTLFQKYVKANSITCNIRTYDGHFSCSNALERGEIDGYIITDNYVVDGVKPVMKIGASDIYFAIANGREDLLADINKAQEQILAASPYYVTYLQSKYFDRSILRQALNDAELTWLKEKKTLFIGYLDGQLPYCGTDATTGQSAGLIAALQNEIASVLDMPVTAVAFESRAGMLQALKAGSIDAAFPLYGDTWTAEQLGVYLTDEIASDRMVAVYYGAYDNSLLDRVGVAGEDVGQLPYLAQYYPDVQIIQYNNIADCIDALKSGIVSSMVADNNIMQRYFSEFLPNEELHFAYLDRPISFSMAVSQSGTVLQSILNKTFTHIDGSKLTDAIARNTYIAASYSFKDFIEHNVVVVIVFLVGLVLLLTFVFIIYRKKSLEHQRQLTQANRAKSEFLSRMSHDIRTPIPSTPSIRYLISLE